MIALSLFDGMGCLYISLIEAGIKIDKYYASEIEKKPIEFTKKNFPDIEHLGDVIKLRHAIVWKSTTFSKAINSNYISNKTKNKLLKLRSIDWSKIDLIGAGSPCQGFSFAGKQLNFNDPRSKLLFVFVDILNHIKKLNPEVLFLLENVQMKKEYQKVINDTLGIFPVSINSNLVSAQNRDRNYWSNIRTREEGLFREIHTYIPQPKDKGILLKDILQNENEVDEKYYLSKKLTSTLANHAEKRNQKFKLNSSNGKAKCITVSHLKQNLDSNYICVAMRGRNPENPSDRKIGSPTEQRLEPKTDGKTNCLISVAKDNLLTDGYKLRRLTPIECARLQTIPKWVPLDGFSDTSLYKMLGNGWTIEVISHILSFIKK